MAIVKGAPEVPDSPRGVQYVILLPLTAQMSYIFMKIVT